MRPYSLYLGLARAVVILVAPLGCGGASVNARGVASGETGAPITPELALVNATALVCGPAYTCARAGDRLVCWGEGPWRPDSFVGGSFERSLSEWLGPHAADAVLISEPWVGVRISTGENLPAIGSPASDERRWGVVRDRGGSRCVYVEGTLTCRFVTDSSARPAEPATVRAFDVGAAFTAWVDDLGALRVYGSGDEHGILSSFAVPAVIPLRRPAIWVTAARSGACVVLDDGGVECLGAITGGVLDEGPRASAWTSESPAAVVTPFPVRRMELFDDGVFYVGEYQLLFEAMVLDPRVGGDGLGRAVEVRFAYHASEPPLLDPSTACAGWSHVCALDREGRVWCIGANRQFQLGTRATLFSDTWTRVGG